MNHKTFGRKIIRELDDSARLLLRALRSPHSLFGFFSSMGWKIDVLTSADLPLVLGKYEAIQQTLQQFVQAGELSQAQISQMGQQLEADFTDLCREVMTASLNNVTDEQIAAFIRDAGQYLLALFLAKNYPLLFQLSELVGLYRFEHQPVLFIAEGDEEHVLREAIPVYRLHADRFLSLPFTFVSDFMAGLDTADALTAEDFIAAVNAKLEAWLREVKTICSHALSEGIEVEFSTAGLSIKGDLFGFSQLAEPVIFQLPPNDKLTLEVNGDQCRLLWGELLDDISQIVPAVSAAGLQLQIGGADTLSADGQLKLFISESDTSVELSGRTGFQLPPDLITAGAPGLQSSGRFLFHYDIAGDYYFRLLELSATGNAQLGGATGLQLSDCSISVQDIQYPVPPTGLDLQLQAGGTLIWQAGDSANQIQVQGAYANGHLQLLATADVHLGNGIWLHALNGQPILKADIDGSGAYAFAVKALFKMPHQNGGTKTVEVQGHLRLTQMDAQVQMTEFALSSQINNLNWELPGGIRLSRAGVAIAFENNSFASALHGELQLENDQSVQLSAALQFPDLNDPENIRIDTLVQISRLNFFDQLYLFAGRLRLQVSTQPLSGMLSISDGSGGFIARGDLNQHPGLSDFHLAVEQLHTVFEFNTNGFELQLSAGKFLLPEVFNQGGSERASAGVGGQPIILLYENQQLTFQTALLIENIGVDLSENGEAGFSALLETATLSLSSSDPIPKISEAAGELTIPLPGRDPLHIAFQEVAWELSGYPVGSVFLAEDVSFPLGGGFALKLRGGAQNGIQTGLTVSKQLNDLPQFVLHGAVDLIIPVDMLTKENGDQIYIGSSGNISWQPGEWPVPELEALRIGGSFRLGGADGIRIQDGELAAVGIAHMLHPTEAQPFQLLLSGKLFLGEEGPGAGIQDASFTFTGEDYPEFDFQGFYVRPGEELLGVMEELPLRVRELEVTFIEPDPLPARLDPTNIRVTLSAELEIPISSGGSLLGMVDDISVHFNNQGIPIRKDGTPGIDIGGIGMGIDGFEAGGIVLTGVVYLGGLDNPADLFFAGKVGGKFNGMGVTALLALGAKGPRGLCLEVSGGSAGISLAYGFMLTGAEGGVIFPNLDGRVSNADPCDIRTYITLNEDGRPERTDQPPTARQEIPEDEPVIGQPSAAAADDIPEFDCPQGDCPPPAVSIISQPHPDRYRYPDRVILKFTSIDEPMLHQLGITPSFFAQLGLTTPDGIAEATAGNLFDLIEQGFPDLNGLPLPPASRNEVVVLADKLKSEARTALVRSLSDGISLALNGNASVYEAVRELAYAGIPSPETTLKLTGTFSYVGVSTFLSVTGGFSISTVMIPQPVPLISTVGILGSINVVGIPVGTARLFLNTTDAKGTPLLLPTICGDVEAGLGPVEFGQLRMKFEAEGLTEGLAGAGMTFAQHLAGPLITELVNLFAAEVLEHPDFDLTHLESVFPLMNFDQLAAFAGALMSLPPERITPDIRACLIELMNNAWQSFNPKFLLCGRVQPRIFGFSLSGELVSAKINISKTAFAAQFGFSPSMILTYYFGNIFPAIDKASVGMAFELPDPIALVNKLISTDLRSVHQMTEYLQEGFEHVLQNAVYTVEYELAPMGLKMADAEARLIMPDLLDHPARPNSNWKRPEDRTDQNYLSRLQLLLRALEVNVLANPLWKGSAEDLDTLTSGAGFGLSMQDYFPHGGFLGAARLSLPLVLLDGVPPSLSAEIFSGDSDLFRRFNAAKNILDNYILKTEDIGRLAFYVPFPNPPSFTVDGQDPTPMQIVRKMQTEGLDWSDIQAGPLLSVEQAFFKGEIQNARLLGVPVFEATVTAYGPDAATQSPGLFEVRAGIPAGSWLEQFVERAELQFTLSQAPPRPVDEYFRELLALMQYHQEHSGRLNTTATVEVFSDAEFKGRVQRLEVGNYRARDLKIGDDQLSSIRIPANAGLQVILYEADNFQGRNIVLTGSMSGLGNFNEIVSSIRVVRATPLENLQALIAEGLPKMILEARIDRMRIPDALAGYFKVQANTSLSVKAYSLFYNPNAIGPGLDAELQRNGGIHFAFQGRFGISGIFEVDIPDIQLALLPFSDTSILPKILGEFTVNRINLPLGLPAIEQGRIYFNSAPNTGQRLVEAKGQLSHIPLGLLSLAPLSGNSMAISMIIERANQGGDFYFNISPARVQSAGFLRSDLTLHGRMFNDPLTISSTSAWHASISGSSVSLFAGRVEALRLSSRNALSGTAGGKGFSHLGLQIGISLNIEVTAFPGHPLLERKLSIPQRGQASMAVESSGKFSLQAEATPFDFGLIRVSGAGNRNVSVQLSQEGFELPAGAELHLRDLTLEPYSLNKMVIRPDATFEVTATGGRIGLRQFFEVSGGKFGLKRDQRETSVLAQSPVFYLFPDTAFSNKMSVGNFTIDSNGFFTIDSANQTLYVPGLVSAKGRFLLTRNRTGVQAGLDSATIKLLPLGLDLSGNLLINQKAVQAKLSSGAIKVSGLIEVSAASWQLDWQLQDHFSLKANSPSLKILHIDVAPKGQFAFTARQDGSFATALATNGNLNILPGLLEAGPASGDLAKSKSGAYSLNLSAQLKALKNPATGQWILSQSGNLQLSGGNFKEEITALRNKTFVDVGLGKVYANNSSRSYFGRTGNSYYFEFSNLKLAALGTESTASGSCTSNGSLNLEWDTAKELALGPFRLTGRKAKVSMNLKNPGFSLIIPGGVLKAPGVTGFPTAGINIPQLNVGADGDFVANLSAFTFNGIGLSTAGSDNHIKLYGKDKMIRIRNKKSLWGANADLSLDIRSNGSVIGSVSGSFTLSNITVGLVQFAGISVGAATLSYSSSRTDYQFQTTITLNNVSGKKKTSKQETKTVWDGILGIFKTVTETVVSWVAQTFKVRVTLKFGSAGAAAEVDIL